MTDFSAPESRLDRALDAALGRALPPPQIPHAFRRRLDAALSRAGETDLSALCARFDSERRVQIAALRSRYVRVRRQTLAILIGAAFAAGAAAPAALPWLQRHVGTAAPLVLTSAGAALGLAIAFLAWRAHARGDAV